MVVRFHFLSSDSKIWYSHNVTSKLIYKFWVLKKSTFIFCFSIHTFNPCIGLGIVQHLRLFCAIWECISRPSNDNNNWPSFKQWAVKRLICTLDCLFYYVNLVCNFAHMYIICNQINISKYSPIDKSNSRFFSSMDKFRSSAEWSIEGIKDNAFCFINSWIAS